MRWETDSLAHSAAANQKAPSPRELSAKLTEGVGAVAQVFPEMIQHHGVYRSLELLRTGAKLPHRLRAELPRRGSLRDFCAKQATPLNTPT